MAAAVASSASLRVLAADHGFDEAVVARTRAVDHVHALAGAIGEDPELVAGFVHLRDRFLDGHGANLDLALAEGARQAFDEGVPLVLELEVEASVERRFLPDATVVSLTRQWQLAYDAISQRYVVTDMANGEQDTHATQADALAALAHLPAIRVADEATLPPDARFGMRVRAAVEIGELPSAIKMLLFWKSWSRSTDWYAWNVRP